MFFSTTNRWYKSRIRCTTDVFWIMMLPGKVYTWCFQAIATIFRPYQPIFRMLPNGFLGGDQIAQVWFALWSPMWCGFPSRGKPFRPVFSSFLPKGGSEEVCKVCVCVCVFQTYIPFIYTVCTHVIKSVRSSVKIYIYTESIGLAFDMPIDIQY